MSASAGPSLDALKRRQVYQVACFLLAVAAVTASLFHVWRAEVVAYRRGEQALARGEFAVAAAELSAAWDGGYRTARTGSDLARSLLGSGRLDDALAHYLRALAAAPRDEALIDTIAGLYQARGEPEKGLPLYAQFGDPAGLSVGALARLGDLQQQAGDHAAAIATYRAAAQRAPRDPELQVRLGVALARSGRRTEAIEALRSAVALDPRHRFAQLYLARVLMWDGRFADAVTEYQRGLSL